MGERRRQQATSYYHPGSGWSDQETGAQLRLRARLSGRVTSVVDNALEALRDGEWVPLGGADERALSPAQRGLVWYGWRSAIAGQPFLMLRGVRAIDETLAATLLDGMVPFDHEGEELEDATLAGIRFALRAPDASVFATRVKGAGGHILPVAADLGEIARHHAGLRAAADALEEIAAWAREVVAAGGRGIALDLHRIEERAEEAWARHRDARRAAASIGPAAEAFAAAGRTVAEQAEAVRIADEALGLERRAEDAFALYRGCEGEAARLLARHGQDDGLAQHLALADDASVDAELLGQLAARLCGQGADARLESGRLIVAVAGGEVVIGTDGVSLRRSV